MKVARILRFGPRNVITNDDLPRPEPAAGQILVRVKAAGVGNWDSLIREGITELFDSGKLVSIVETVLPLQEARIAHEMLGGARHKRGKIVLRIAD